MAWLATVTEVDGPVVTLSNGIEAVFTGSVSYFPGVGDVVSIEARPGEPVQVKFVRPRRVN
jgi:hypothetical protein